MHSQVIVLSLVESYISRLDKAAAKTFVKMFSHLVSVSLTLMFFNRGHFLDAPETHSSLYCVSPEIGKWRIRHVICFSPRYHRIGFSCVIEEVWSSLTLFSAIECATTVIDFLHHHNRTSLWSIWLSCVITDLHKEQISTSSRFKQNKPQKGLQQKSEFLLGCHEIHRTKKKFRKRVRATECQSKKQIRHFPRRGWKNKNKWLVKWGISENVDQQEFKLNILWAV